jgi:feruloyl-CoA synthase
VGQLRAHLLSHLAPEVRDVVIVGENREYIVALGIPSNETVAQDREARERVAAKLKALGRSAAGSAQRVQRFAFLISKLSIDEGEITDKGVLNQRTIVRRHADLIDTLYSDHPPADTIVVQPIYRGRDLRQVIESVRPDRPAVGVAAVTQFPPAETTS